MRAWLLVFVIVTISCERSEQTRSVETWRPFALGDWRAMPSDAQIVDAIVGRGGTASDRVVLRELASRFLVPAIHSYGGTKDLDSLRGYFRGMAWEFSDQKTSPLQAAVTVAVANGAYPIVFDALGLAKRRACIELWPDEPCQQSDKYRALDLATVERRATVLRQQLRELRRLAEPHAPDAFADGPVGDDRSLLAAFFVRAASDDVRIALGEGYDRSNYELHQSLVEHGIATTRTPDYYSDE